MALGRELPDSLAGALALAKQLLSNRADLVEKGLIETEAEQIVMAATGLRARIDLFVHAKDRISEETAEKVLVMAMGRAEGKILQHLTGFQDFLDHRYRVSADVLVPRPETELLVATAIERLLDRPPSVGIEIGLGSGVLSIELLAAFPKLRMIASEISPAAEAIALENLASIVEDPPGAEPRLAIRRAKDPFHVWEPFGANDHGQFLISNPPYLAAGDPMDDEVAKHEPALALFAPGTDPLHFYRKIAEKGPKRLLRGSYAFLEMPSFRAVAISKLFVDNGWEVEILKDLAGRDRILIGRLAERAEDQQDEKEGSDG